MLVLEEAKRYPNATFFGLNPGLVKTNIRDNFFGKGPLKSRVMESEKGRKRGQKEKTSQGPCALGSTIRR
jgi:hypothetical protein